MWQAVGKISSIFSLIAFLAAVCVVGYRYRIRLQEGLVSKLPPNDRASRVDAILEGVSVNTESHSRPQRYDLAVRIINARARRYTTIAAVVIALAVVAALVSMVANKKTESHLAVADTSFPQGLSFSTGWIFVGYNDGGNYIEGPFAAIVERGSMLSSVISRLPRVGDIVSTQKERRVIIANYKTDGLKYQNMSPAVVKGSISDEDETGIRFQQGQLLIVRDVVESAFPEHASAIWCRVASCDAATVQCQLALGSVAKQ
jgi:hypothetical protein